MANGSQRKAEEGNIAMTNATINTDMQPGDIKLPQNATVEELLNDILDRQDPKSKIFVSVLSDGRIMVSDRLCCIAGIGSTLKDALINFQVLFWETSMFDYNSYGFFSEEIDWGSYLTKFSKDGEK